MPSPTAALLGLLLVLADEEPLEIQVNRAITLAVDRLLADQEAPGTWGTWDRVHPRGRTALALLALLHSGLPASDPRVARGVEALLRALDAERTTEGGHAPSYSTYESGAILLLLHALGPRARFVEAMRPIVRHLAETFDEREKLWGYPDGGRDLSNTQFALLGLRAASLRGVRPRRSRRLWTQALEGVLRCKKEGAGFAYRPERLPSASMTVAGLAVVRLAAEELDGFAPARRVLKEARAAAKEAHAWLEERFAVATNADGRSQSRFHLLYYLWGLERYAVFAGLDRIGDHDWYREGARFLVRLQHDDGGFGSVEETCFALLFLRRAAITAPRGDLVLLEDARRDDNPRLDEPPLAPDPDAPALREWLVLGSFRGRENEDDALDRVPVRPERLRPLAGRRAGKRRWTRYSSPDDEVDLQAAGAGDPWSATFAATFLESDRARDVLLWVGSDDGVRVWLDGEQVLDHHHHDFWPHIKVPLRLPEGRSTLLLEVENTGYFCKFVARITDPSGRPLEGVAATTHPPQRGR